LALHPSVHTGKTVSQIGRELRVDYVLEGSVRREGGKARVSVQLVRVSDQTHLWAQNYDRDLEDLLDVQNELGRAIAEQVRANLTPQPQIDLAKNHMVNPEAYDLYLKGRFYWNQRTPDAIKESIGYFQQATAKDGNFALAYAGLADAYNISNIIGPVSPRDSFPQAKAAAMRAIQLDPAGRLIAAPGLALLRPSPLNSTQQVNLPAHACSPGPAQDYGELTPSNVPDQEDGADPAEPYILQSGP
jgi:hypothetical protein